VATFSEYLLYRLHILNFKTPMASNVWTSVWAFCGGLSGILIATLLTEAPDPEKMQGLVYDGSAPIERSGLWYATPEFYAVVVLLGYLALNIKFF
jgi:hypothetical protein